MSFPLNKLQKLLEYKFDNIQLLHEALTHDFDSKNSKWDIFNDGNVFYPKRKLHRLKCVGVSVLKLLIAEKAVIVHNKSNDDYLSAEGTLTKIRQQFDSQCDFSLVGEKLKIWKYIDSRKYVNIKNALIYKEVIQAIFGAVFIDEGGCEVSNSINSVRKLFDLLISKYGLCSIKYPNSQDLYNCFTLNYPFIRETFMRKEYARKIRSYKKLEKQIDYRFVDSGLIKTALTHDSIRSFIPDILHYEVLEFLGDAVYELVICDYLFWNYINDRDGKQFNFGTLTKFVEKRFQEVIAKGLKLEKFIIKPDHVTVSDIHDFLESIIGAIFVDSKSLKLLKTILVKLCRQFEIKTVLNCGLSLPFELRTYYGSSYHIPITKLDRIKEEHSWPPKRQDTFEIKNLDKLILCLGNYYEHKRVSGTIYSYNSKDKVLGSESWCNQQEFGRTSLFEAMNRIWFLDEKVYFYDTAKTLLQYHTYAWMYKDYPQKITESSESSNGDGLIPESILGNDLDRDEISFKDVVRIVNLWMEKCVMDLKKIFMETLTLLFSLIGIVFYIWLFLKLDWPLRAILVGFTVVAGLYDQYFGESTS